VSAINSTNTPDYLLLIMLTGMRKGEAGRLLWDDISLYERSFVIRDTKNGKDHALPMCSFVFDLLSRRKENATTPWVFPNRKKNVPMSTESTNMYDRICRDTGIAFSPHDLRRTFVTMAVSVKTDHYQLNQLINHCGGGDVTFRQQSD
jgi:integrase